MTAGSSKVEYERDLVVPLADGTRLSGNLYRPAGGPAGPVLVSCYPYRKDDIIGSLFDGTRIRLCERGYASLFVDMTGTGASRGTYGESWDLATESRDCAEIVEWAAGQDWCDGNVGAWGVSYGGMTALGAAAERPPHLRAIVAAYATTDIYRDTIAPGGWPSMLGGYAWAAHMAALDLCPPTLQDPAGQWRQVWDQRLQRLAAGELHALTWQAHPQRDAYWQKRAVDATAVMVPTMLIGGWADAYTGAIIRVFGEVKGPKRLILGPWMHVLPHLSTVEPWDWVTEMADWWDAHLRPDGAPPAQEQPVLFFARGGGWQAARQWPPEDTGNRQLYLDGYRLDPALPSAPGFRDYAGDPLTGLTAGIWDPFGIGNGWPEEQSSDDARSLTFTSDPLLEPLLVAGAPEAALQVKLTPGEETHLVARLCQVEPDGRSELITSGWCHLPAAQGSPDMPVRTVEIRLNQAACELSAGTRVRLSIACANFPHLWPAPSTPAITVVSGPDSPSVLRLPVSPDTGHTPVTVARPPAKPDTGWVTSGEPVYRLTHDKNAGEAAVTFGARSQLRTPAGAQLSLDEEFTARVRASRPDGAAVLGRVDINLRMPAGEQVEVHVASTSYRRTSVVEASVTLDGASLLHHRWAGPPNDLPPASL